ncbi:hypothetical protein C8F01DRAFT_1154723 [Mycena amicta]|nr:hypothetical protein C8F01DRAFT_1154723 [Mycena amicta]
MDSHFPSVERGLEYAKQHWQALPSFTFFAPAPHASPPTPSGLATHASSFGLAPRGLERQDSAMSSFWSISNDELAEDAPAQMSAWTLDDQDDANFGAALGDLCSYPMSDAGTEQDYGADFEIEMDDDVESSLPHDSQPESGEDDSPPPSPLPQDVIDHYLSASTATSFMPGAPFHAQLDAALDLVTGKPEGKAAELVASAEWWWKIQEAIAKGLPIPQVNTKPDLQASDLVRRSVRQACVASIRPTVRKVMFASPSPPAPKPTRVVEPKKKSRATADENERPAKKVAFVGKGGKPISTSPTMVAPTKLTIKLRSPADRPKLPRVILRV